MKASMKLFLNDKRVAVGLILLSIALLLLMYLGYQIIFNRNKIEFNFSDTTILGDINGQEVTVREYRAAVNRNQEAVRDFFARNYGVRNLSGDNWKKSYKGVVPVVELRHMAVDDLKMIKTVQALREQYNLESNINYIEFLKELHEEKKISKRAIENIDSKLGRLTRAENEEFFKIFDRHSQELKEYMFENVTEVTFDDILKYYYTNREQFKKPDQVFLGVTVFYYDDQDPNREMSIFRFSSEMEEFMKRLRSGADPENLMRKFDKYETISANFYVEKLHEISNIGRNEYLEQLVEIGSQMEYGDIELFNLVEYYYIVQCIGKYDDGYYPLDDDIKQIITNEIKRISYEPYIKSLANMAEANLNLEIMEELLR